MSHRVRIYYDDPSSRWRAHDVVNPGWDELIPKEGVLCIGQPSDEYNWIVTHGANWYVYRKDLREFLPCDDAGFQDQVKRHLPRIGLILQGVSSANGVFDEAMMDAAMDPKIPTPSPIA